MSGQKRTKASTRTARTPRKTHTDRVDHTRATQDPEHVPPSLPASFRGDAAEMGTEYVTERDVDDDFKVGGND